MCNGATPLFDMVKAVTTFRQPNTIKGLQEFVGMTNFYRCFIPLVAKIMSPLFSALLCNAKRQARDLDGLHAEGILWGQRGPSGAALHTHPCKGAPMALTTDASHEAVGAVLQQWAHEEWLPLAFFSEHFGPLPRDPAFQVFPGRKGAQHTPTTSPSHLVWLNYQIHGPVDSRDT